MMKTGLGLMLLFMLTNTLEMDFGTNKAGADWYIVVDGVMGGLSTGKGNLTENSMVFRGDISLENNGGFSSLRSPFGQFDLSKYSYVTLRFRNKGQDFAFVLERYRPFYLPNYKYVFTNDSEDWQVVKLPLKDFGEYRIGRATGNKVSKEALENIIRIGFINDGKKSGPFELEIDYVKFE